MKHQALETGAEGEEEKKGGNNLAVQQPLSMNQLDIKNMKVIKSTTFDLGLYSSVITASDDWIYTRHS